MAFSAAAVGSAFADESHAAQGDTSQGTAGDYSITVEQLNGSGVEGSAVITLEENGDLAVHVEASGLVPGQPHAQHIHGSTDLDTDFTCPGPDADEDGDGIVSTAEGLPAYGDIHISLTTEGDSSPDSGLAVERMPVADDNGNLEYSRTFSADELPDGTAAAIRNLHIVQHGIDVNGNGEYDADAGQSSLDPELPLEATAPASCGMIEGSNISDIPGGGVDTGNGQLVTADGPAVDQQGIVLVAGAGLGMGAAIGAVAYRRFRTEAR
ncbi:superoxide dismutase family protein [Phytoactinopolyspora halotolerans]|nr:superoxide dismutase family protein [Phytoactinopolyspora halotolerans]